MKIVVRFSSIKQNDVARLKQSKRLIGITSEMLN